MKIIDRYIIFSILKVAIVAIFVFAFILAAVELFGRMDSIINGVVPVSSIIKYAILSIPQYLMMVSSLAFLFSTTYFLSMLSANNEMIAILNAGIGRARIALPVILLSIFMTFISVVAKEVVINPLISMHDIMGQELFGLSGSNDVRNIVLRDENGFVVYTRRYIESSSTILSPVSVRTEEGRIVERVEGERAFWMDNQWVVEKAKVFEINDDEVKTEYYDQYPLGDFSMGPEFFQSANLNVETMSLSSAIDYLKRLKLSSPVAWQEKCTDYLRSLFSPVAIFVLMTVAATMGYGKRKNVLLFSIIQCLCIAVVYYVSDMVFSIASHQGTFHPSLSVILPPIVTIAINFIIDRIGRLL